MSEQNNTQVIGADVKRLPFKDLVKRIGPGLIATGIVIGPGAVTTAAMLGSSYGYSLMWLVWPIIFMGMTFMMVTNRLAIVTGMPTIHAIRKYYGPVASGVVGCAIFLSCMFHHRDLLPATVASASPRRSTNLHTKQLHLP